MALQGSPKATLDCVISYSTTDFREDLSFIDIPTLIIHGDNDKTVPIEISGNKTAKLIPHAQYLVYEGAPHGLFYTERERLNNDLIEFITETIRPSVNTSDPATNKSTIEGSKAL